MKSNACRGDVRHRSKMKLATIIEVFNHKVEIEDWFRAYIIFGVHKSILFQAYWIKREMYVMKISMNSTQTQFWRHKAQTQFWIYKANIKTVNSFTFIKWKGDIRHDKKENEGRERIRRRHYQSGRQKNELTWHIMHIVRKM